MTYEIELSDAGRQYAAAHAAHYIERDLTLALQLYQALMGSHPEDPEADYSRSQVQNIVNAVVPREALLSVQMELAFAHLRHVA